MFIMCSCPEVWSSSAQARSPYGYWRGGGGSLLADPHLLLVGSRFPLYVGVEVLKGVVVYVWKAQQLAEKEDFE